MKSTKLSLFFILFVCVYGCRSDLPTERAPVVSTSELDSTSKLNILCETDSQNEPKLTDLAGNEVGFCHLFSETSSNILITHFVNNDCIDCMDSILETKNILAQSNFDKKIQQVVVYDSNTTKEEIQSTIEDLDSKNMIWLHDSKNQMKNFIPNYLADAQHVILFSTHQKTHAQSGTEELSSLDIIQISKDKLGMDLKDTNTTFFQWSGNSNQDSESWSIHPE